MLYIAVIIRHEFLEISYLRASFYIDYKTNGDYRDQA